MQATRRVLSQQKFQGLFPTKTMCRCSSNAGNVLRLWRINACPNLCRLPYTSCAPLSTAQTFNRFGNPTRPATSGALLRGVGKGSQEDQLGTAPAQIPARGAFACQGGQPGHLLELQEKVAETMEREERNVKKRGGIVAKLTSKRKARLINLQTL